MLDNKSYYLYLALGARQNTAQLVNYTTKCLISYIRSILDIYIYFIRENIVFTFSVSLDFLIAIHTTPEGGRESLLLLNKYKSLLFS